MAVLRKTKNTSNCKKRIHKGGAPKEQNTNANTNPLYKEDNKRKNWWQRLSSIFKRTSSKRASSKRASSKRALSKRAPSTLHTNTPPLPPPRRIKILSRRSLPLTPPQQSAVNATRKMIELERAYIKSKKLQQKKKQKRKTNTKKTHSYEYNSKKNALQNNKQTEYTNKHIYEEILGN